jgi:hypothetical protein
MNCLDGNLSVHSKQVLWFPIDQDFPLRAWVSCQSSEATDVARGTKIINMYVAPKAYTLRVKLGPMLRKLKPLLLVYLLASEPPSPPKSVWKVATDTLSRASSRQTAIIPDRSHATSW